MCDITQKKDVMCPHCGNTGGMTEYQYMTVEKRRKKWWIFTYYQTAYVTYVVSGCYRCGTEWQKRQSEIVYL